MSFMAQWRASKGRTLMAPLRAARGPATSAKNELIVRLNVVTVSPLYVANALDPIVCLPVLLVDQRFNLLTSVTVRMGPA
jgi:hypothetical protein